MINLTVAQQRALSDLHQSKTGKYHAGRRVRAFDALVRMGFAFRNRFDAYGVYQIKDAGKLFYKDFLFAEHPAATGCGEGEERLT